MRSIKNKLRRKLTIRISDKSLFWTEVGAIGGIVGVIVAVATIYLDNGQNKPVVVNSPSEAQKFQNNLPADATSEEARALAARYANVKPSPKGPWAFYVLDTQIGLKVRTSGVQAGVQIGSAGDGALVWAECRQITSFAPPAEFPVGPRWLRIRWPNNNPTKKFMDSSPEDPYTGYVYEGYVVPAGHNGHIPAC